MFSKFFYNTSISIFKKFKQAIIKAPFIFLVLLYGCGFLSAVPVTLKEIKDYTVGQQESFSYPLDLVLATTIYNLREMGFIILRIEDFNRYDTATPTFESPTMSMKELKQIHDKAHQSFYLRPTYVIRAFSKGGVYGYSTTRTALAWLRRSIASKLGLR